MDLKDIGGGIGVDSSGSGFGPVAGFYEHSNAFSGTIKR
jgi:hypothetical protein